MENSQDTLDVPNTELDKVDQNVCEIMTEDKNNCDSKLDDAVPIKKEIIEQTDNNTEECGYSVKDKVIIIDDEADDINKLSASQLFPVNDPYCKIKEELSEFDRVEECQAVLVDSDDCSDFDIFEILNDTQINSASKALDLNVLGKDDASNIHKVSPNSPK